MQAHPHKLAPILTQKVRGSSSERTHCWSWVGGIHDLWYQGRSWGDSHCGGSNEDDSHKLRYLNTWSSGNCLRRVRRCWKRCLSRGDSKVSKDSHHFQRLCFLHIALTTWKTWVQPLVRSSVLTCCCVIVVNLIFSQTSKTLASQVLAVHTQWGKTEAIFRTPLLSLSLPGVAGALHTRNSACCRTAMPNCGQHWERCVHYDLYCDWRVSIISVAPGMECLDIVNLQINEPVTLHLY